MQLWKIISTFHKDYPEKSTRTFLPVNSTPSMAKPFAKPLIETLKQKFGWSNKTSIE